MSRIGAHVIEIEELEALKDPNDLTIPLPDYEKFLESQEPAINQLDNEGMTEKKIHAGF